jgi:hypothetical protein
MAVASLLFEDNGTRHRDLVLRLDHFERRCDSFYLGHDNDVLPGRRDAEKVRLVLVRLLEQWLREVTVLSSGETTYLPYEFDDQATGWLQVSAVSEETVEVLPVWSDLAGWEMTPSRFPDVQGRVGKPTPVWKNLAPQGMTRQELLAQIEESIQAASA